MQKRSLIMLSLALAVACLIPSGSAMAQDGPKVVVWTGDVVQNEERVSEPGDLEPMTIVAARNGSFSSKVVLESAGKISGAKASISPLSAGGETIPAENIQIRYAVPWESTGFGWPSGPDILMEEAPAEVGPQFSRGKRALLPVWVTIRIPEGAKATTYTGELTVSADGLESTKVPVQVEVVDWALPAPQDYRTWIDFIQSPDTLALEYDVPLWSDRHWELIASAFEQMRYSGNSMLYVPLICRTNFGNEQSMVRWIDKGEGKYEHDFSILDKYLEVAEKHLGKPKKVVFIVWDVCMSENSLKRSLWGDSHGGAPTREGREELLGKGPRVTKVNPANGETEMIFLPRYEEEGGKAAWKPLWTELSKRMKARGLDKTMSLGVLSDLWPSKEEVTALNEIAGGLPWVSQSHPNALKGETSSDNKKLHGLAAINYAAHVYNQTYQVNPDLGRLYGWRNDAMTLHYLRGGDLNMGSSIDIRMLTGLNITGGQRGSGRLGGDLWPVLKDNRGRRKGKVYHRYPENNWRNLDIGSWFLAPGANKVLGTARLENLVEGIQESEARIYIESVLLDDAQRQKIGKPMAEKAQKLLDELHKAMWKTVWSNDEDLASVGTISGGRNAPEGMWGELAKKGKELPGYWSGEGHKVRNEEARKGQKWWFESGWKNRNRQLFTMASEIQKKLGK